MWKKISTFSIDEFVLSNFQKLLKWTSLSTSSIIEKVMKDFTNSFIWIKNEDKIIFIKFNNFDWYQIKSKLKICLDLLIHKEDKEILNLIWLKEVVWMNSLKTNEWEIVDYFELKINSSDIETSYKILELKLNDIFNKKFKDTYEVIKSKKLDILDSDIICWDSQQETMKQFKRKLFILN